MENRVVEVYDAAMVLADGPIGGAVQAQLNAKGVNITDTLINVDQAIEDQIWAFNQSVTEIVDEA